jgi:hypothetical protein
MDARVAQTSLRSLRKLDCVPAHDGSRITTAGITHSRFALNFCVYGGQVKPPKLFGGRAVPSRSPSCQTAVASDYGRPASTVVVEASPHDILEEIRSHHNGNAVDWLLPDRPELCPERRDGRAQLKSHGAVPRREILRAIPLAQRAMAIREKALGPDHPDVATVAEQPG